MATRKAADSHRFARPNTLGSLDRVLPTRAQADGASVESEEVAPGIVLDTDAEEHVVGIEIEDASKHSDLTRLELSALPFTRLVFSERRASHG